VQLEGSGPLVYQVPREEDPDAIVKGFVKVGAKEEAVCNIPSHVDVVRYLS
jgi:hypothetical protein